MSSILNGSATYGDPARLVNQRSVQLTYNTTGNQVGGG
jgi:hypothetical protein